MKKNFGSWSQRGQTLNEKLRRCQAALFLGYLPYPVIAGVENFRRSATQKLLEKMKKNFRSWSQRGQALNEKLRRKFFLARIGYFSVISLG